MDASVKLAAQWGKARRALYQCSAQCVKPERILERRAIKMGCRVTSIDDLLRSFFGWLGYQVGKRPVYFIIVPFLLTALCASGFQRITYEADPEYLFSPQNGEAKFERAQMEKHFPMNYSAFHPGRVSRHGRFGRLLIRARDNGTLLRNDIFQQVIFLL